MKKEKRAEKAVSENDCDNIKAHPAAWFMRIFFLLCLLIFFYFISNGYIGSTGESDLFLLNVSLLAINVIMMIILLTIIKIKTTSYYICKKNNYLTIGEDSGFWLFKKRSSLEVNSKTSILIEKSWLGCFFDYGDVYFYVNTIPSIKLCFVKNPDEFVEKIKKKLI